ncbi:MAG: AsmA family protein, partial [Bosea sp. (in: a-proteobacteria)]
MTHLFRESLTALAGLLIAALFAALALPPFIDWTALKPRIEARLAAITGMTARIDGPVRISLLPQLSLRAEAVMLGADDDAASARIARLDMATPLASLMRGEIRFGALGLDGVDVRLRPDARLGLRWQQRGAVDVAIDAATVTRGRVIVHRAVPQGAAETVIAPLAASISTPSLVGPWRIEGEMAGEPFRLVTGVAEAGGDSPAKFMSDNGRRRIEIDGNIGFEIRDGLALPRWAGLAQLVLKGANADPAASLSLRGSFALGVLTGDAVSLDLGSAGRLEGTFAWSLSGPEAQLQLTSRRLVADGLAEMAGTIGQSHAGALPMMLLPRALSVQLSAAQMMWRGEEFADVKASFRL